jgi:hypothetical protein
MLKLKKLLNEAPADDVQKVADADLAGTVSMLKKLSSDKDVVNVLQKGASDGDIKDEQVKFSSAPIACTKLFPTQAEIGFGNSLDDLCIAQPWASCVERAFSEPVLMPSVPDKVPILAAKVGGKTWILDGHHRWSLCFMINRNAAMQCDIMEVPSGIDAEGALKIMHMAIAAKAGSLLTKDFEGQDLMGVGSEVVKQYVLDTIEPKRIEEFTAGNPKLNSKEAIAADVAVAHGKIKGMKGEFARKIMPQAGASGAVGGQDGVNKALSRGAINWKEPFKDVSDGYKLTGTQLKEHFQKIAKIK